MYPYNSSDAFWDLADAVTPALPLPDRRCSGASTSGFDTGWWQTLYEYLPAICLILDAAGTIKQVNRVAAERLGYGVDALVGQSLAMVVQLHAVDAMPWRDWLAAPHTCHTWFTHLRSQNAMLIPVQIAIQVAQQGERTALILVCTEPAAIQQSELLYHIQNLNQVLESTVQERTAQLSRSLQHESLVRRITDRVRDSLDEDHILQTVVQELLTELGLECCDAGIYDLDAGTSTIAYESTQSLAPARHTVVQMADYPDIYRQLFWGLSFQFCDIQRSNHRQKSHLYAMLVCPIYDDQGTLGDVWLFRPCDRFFDDLEVRLVEQVASQCAIALRQSRLYDAAQRQVEELAKLNQLKDDFLSTVSHELRSPMANIKMATEMLEMYLEHTELLTDDKLRSSHYFRILRDECERESNLINDLLDLSRLDADSEPLLCNTLHLNAWILHLSEAFVRRTETRHQQLVFDLPPNIPPLTTDFTFLERVLTELLHNACKYTPEGKTISVSLQWLCPGLSTGPDSLAKSADLLPSRPLWQITVANTGVEIPPEEQIRIFDKFYRVPNNDPWRTGGTGLGLALVKKRVERLGGQIEVTSENLRTAFVIQLPCLASDTPSCASYTMSS